MRREGDKRIGARCDASTRLRLLQFMRAVDPTFDERKFGFGSLQDLLRACQRDGLFRIERDRQGVIRLFPGNIMQPMLGIDDPDDARRDVVDAPVGESGQGWPVDEAAAQQAYADSQPYDGESASEGSSSEDVVDGAVLQELDAQPVVDGVEADAESGPEPGNEAEPPKRGRGGKKRATSGARGGARKTESAAPRSRKTPSRPRAPRSRKPAVD